MGNAYVTPAFIVYHLVLNEKARLHPANVR